MLVRAAGAHQFAGYPEHRSGPIAATEVATVGADGFLDLVRYPQRQDIDLEQVTEINVGLPIMRLLVPLNGVD